MTTTLPAVVDTQSADQPGIPKGRIRRIALGLEGSSPPDGLNRLGLSVARPERQTSAATFSGSLRSPQSQADSAPCLYGKSCGAPHFETARRRRAVVQVTALTSKRTRAVGKCFLKIKQAAKSSRTRAGRAPLRDGGTHSHSAEIRTGDKDATAMF